DLAGQVPSTQAEVIIAFMDDNPSTLVDLEPVKSAKNIKIYYNASELMQKNGVDGFPTIMLFKDGEPVETWRGYSPDHVAGILEALKELK
ncbi:MAG: thioredoxin family protein, partial [Elusimicrobiaceae bacterium]|nr:thioredoxin family protein [Elusimicrobiaceae bacterium]